MWINKKILLCFYQDDISLDGDRCESTTKERRKKKSKEKIDDDDAMIDDAENDNKNEHVPSDGNL